MLNSSCCSFISQWHLTVQHVFNWWEETDRNTDTVCWWWPSLVIIDWASKWESKNLENFAFDNIFHLEKSGHYCYTAALQSVKNTLKKFLLSISDAVTATAEEMTCWQQGSKACIYRRQQTEWQLLFCLGYLFYKGGNAHANWINWDKVFPLCEHQQQCIYCTI